MILLIPFADNFEKKNFNSYKGQWYFFGVEKVKSGRNHSTFQKYFYKPRISMGTQNHLKQSDLGKSLDPIVCTFKLSRVQLQSTRFYQYFSLKGRLFYVVSLLDCFCWFIELFFHQSKMNVINFLITSYFEKQIHFRFFILYFFKKMHWLFSSSVKFLS